ncbi:hypothetical protein V0U79_04295 [Hyphobacterium sp. HN65]|uniref:Uncharacterized protein n=1 Tax=Hyphobacterium lacteum TaxID=3116575 RepID=A0ABU7LNT2_9PROT|nr:hypothetical protein [Hyphobacterium sp. HN65]MEE2525575.1 hypothetical protein [Hyphobacterium sp. HN65]
MRVFLIAIAGLALVSCATTSEDGDMASNDAMEPAAPAATQMAAEEPATPARSAENEPDPNREICRTERVTGQLRRQRICRTAAQWEAIREAGRDSVGSRQTSGYQESPQ